MTFAKTGGAFVLSAIILPGLAGCAGNRLPRLPVCDGKHLRDVNVHGTVLPGPQQPSGQSSGDAAPEQGAATPSARAPAEWLASLAPCREKA